MTPNKEDYEQIRRYLVGVMSAEEQAEFERRIAENEDMELEVELQRLQRDMVNQARERELRNLISQWKQEPAPTPAKPRFAWIIGLLAVGVTIMIGRQLWQNRPHPQDPIILTRDTIQEIPPIKTDNGDTLDMPPAVIPKPDDTTKTMQIRSDYYAGLSSKAKEGLLNQAVKKDPNWSGHLGGSATDWKSLMVAGDYAAAWPILDSICRQPGNRPGNRPTEFYFAALLKIYWKPALDFDAVKTLETITPPIFQDAFGNDVPLTELYQHQVMAYLQQRRTAQAITLLRINPSLQQSFPNLLKKGRGD